MKGHLPSSVPHAFWWWVQPTYHLEACSRCSGLEPLLFLLLAACHGFLLCEVIVAKSSLYGVCLRVWWVGKHKVSRTVLLFLVEKIWVSHVGIKGTRQQKKESWWSSRTLSTAAVLVWFWSELALIQKGPISYVPQIIFLSCLRAEAPVSWWNEAVEVPLWGHWSFFLFQNSPPPPHSLLKV